jgi:hypothetical protein
MRLGVALKIRQRVDVLPGDHKMQFNVLRRPWKTAAIWRESKRENCSRILA